MVFTANASSKIDLEGILPFDASYLKALSPPQETLVADILLVGGKEAMNLNLALKSLQKDQVLSKIRISSITSSEFNIARLYSLFTYHPFGPKWIIYLPSLDDEKEEIFDHKDADSLQYNLQRGNTWWWQILYKIWPRIALVTLKKVKKITLQSDPSLFLDQLSDSHKIQRSLASATLFNVLLKQIIVQHEKTNFLFISTAFDTNNNPQNCKTSISWPTKTLYKEQIKSLEEKNWDQALLVNDHLKQVAPFYASTYYFRAKIFKELQNPESAYRFLSLSWMLNCHSPYVALKNTVLQTLSSEFPERIYFYDLAKLVNDACFATDKNCFDGSDLQQDYYKTTAEVIKLLINEKMKL